MSSLGPSYGSLAANQAKVSDAFPSLFYSNTLTEFGLFRSQPNVIQPLIERFNNGLNQSLENHFPKVLTKMR